MTSAQLPPQLPARWWPATAAVPLPSRRVRRRPPARALAGLRLAEREQHALEVVRGRRSAGASARRESVVALAQVVGELRHAFRDRRGRARGRRRSGAPPWPARLRSGRRVPLRPPWRGGAGGGHRSHRTQLFRSSVSAIGLPSWRHTSSAQARCMAAFSPALNTASRAAPRCSGWSARCCSRSSPVSPGIIRSVTSAKRPAAPVRSRHVGPRPALDLEFLQRQRDEAADRRVVVDQQHPRSHDSPSSDEYVGRSPEGMGRFGSGPALGPRHAVGDAAVPSASASSWQLRDQLGLVQPPARRPARRRRARAALRRAR